MDPWLTLGLRIQAPPSSIIPLSFLFVLDSRPHLSIIEPATRPSGARIWRRHGREWKSPWPRAPGTSFWPFELGSSSMLRKTRFPICTGSPSNSFRMWLYVSQISGIFITSIDRRFGTPIPGCRPTRVRGPYRQCGQRFVDQCHYLLYLEPELAFVFPASPQVRTYCPPFRDFTNAINVFAATERAEHGLFPRQVNASTRGISPTTSLRILSMVNHLQPAIRAGGLPALSPTDPCGRRPQRRVIRRAKRGK